MMREKVRHRLAVVAYSFLWLFAGVFAVAMVHRAGNIWFDLCVAIVFLIVSGAVAVSPRFRRYMLHQSLSVHRFHEGGISGKYSILDDEFEAIRDACLKRMSSERPEVCLHKRHSKQWEAVKDERNPTYAFALIPGMFEISGLPHRASFDIRTERCFAGEACVVAFWNGFAWEPTAMLLPGNVKEAISGMESLISESRYSC